MEVAAGLVAAEQVIATTIEGGVVAGVAIAQPTQPLKATFTRIATSPDSDAPDSLQRSSHTITVLNGRAFIFGGITPGGDLASNDMHIVALPGFNNDGKTEYQCIPALPSTSDPSNSAVPGRRAGHSASVSGNNIIIYGGEEGAEDFHIWAFDTQMLSWKKLEENSGHDLVSYKEKMVIIPDIPQEHVNKPSMVIAGDALFALDHSASHVDTIYELDLSLSAEGTGDELVTELKDAVWRTITLPSGPKSNVPESRIGASIASISSGHGRHYALQLFGIQHDPQDTLSSGPTYLADMWALQLPSEQNSTTKYKDATRETLNFSSGEFSWAKVEVQTKDHEVGMEGKSLIGPLAHYAVSNVDEKTLLLWGGIDPKGQTSGDGWLIKFE